MQEWVSARSVKLRVEARCKVLETEGADDDEDECTPFREAIAADPAGWISTNTSEFAEVVDVPELLQQWGRTLDAGPSRGDDRTRTLSFLALSLPRYVFDASHSGGSARSAIGLAVAAAQQRSNEMLWRWECAYSPTLGPSASSTLRWSVRRGIRRLQRR